MLQHDRVCALLPTPLPCAGHKHQHGFTTREKNGGNKYLGRLDKAEKKPGLSRARR